jgi:mRNA-degrading endonuclease toxin of MazEF toxin-antitoxin module
MPYKRMYNSEHYRDPTAYYAIRNIEREQRGSLPGSEYERDFRRGDVYLANLGYGYMNSEGNHVQGGVRPVVVIQNDLANLFSPTLVVVPLTSKIMKRPEFPTHYLIRKPRGGLSSDSLALGEQITTIDKRQCLQYLGLLSEEETDAIRDAAVNGLDSRMTIPPDPETA